VHLVPRVVRNLKARLRPSSRLGDDCSHCAPAATNPKVYVEHYAARVVACRAYHIGSLPELPYTMCDVVVPLLVAFNNTQSHTGMGILSPKSQGSQEVRI
jgi:hypothetical protein